MTKLRHGHIYFISFEPSSGHEYKKTRPAVIISSDALVKRSNLITCVPLTGKTQNFLDSDDLVIKKDDKNNLYCDSLLKTHHISTFDKKRVKKYIGELDGELLSQLKKTIIRNFGLNK